MEVKIAVQNVAREVQIDAEGSHAEIATAVEAALREGTVLSLRDAKGREVHVPGSAIGYVQFGEQEKGRVGFGG